MRSIIIIGGGISGLATAYHIQEHLPKTNKPLACILIDDQKQFGGKILTERENGFIIEAGPDSFITQKPWALDLCKKLGLTDHLIPTNQEQKKIYVYSGGRLHPLPEGLVLMVPTRLMPFLSSSLISPLGKLRMAMDLFIPARKDTGDESLADFARRRLGQEALDKIVEPLMAGIYVGKAETLSLASTFPRFMDLEREYGSLIRGLIAKRQETARKSKAERSPPLAMFMTLKGGVGEMVEALITKLDRIQLEMGKRVREVRQSRQTDAAYEVEMENGTSIMANAVILTTPAFVTASLIQKFNSALAQELHQIPYVSTATISLAYKQSECKHPLDGYGFVVARNEGRKIMACTWTSTKFPNRAPQDYVLLRCFVGGTEQEPLVDLDNQALVQMVREELKITMGMDAPPMFTWVYRWRQANPLYLVGHLDRMARIETLLKQHPGLFLTGSAYYGVGIPDCIHEGTRTAQQALEFLHP
ncbi:MAG: protoporphyrinogen oxidase [Nitrospira sp.]|nr:protoporphyrinogen oxidase [Nitrospira sp.]